METSLQVAERADPPLGPGVTMDVATSDHCDICGDREIGPFKALHVMAEEALLEGEEKLLVHIHICWACWNGQTPRERATLIALGALNKQLNVTQSLIGRVIKTLSRWL